MSYDSKCFDLADTFLQDHPHLWTGRRIGELAQVIQDAIEDYFTTEQDNYEPPDPPGFEGGFADNH
jgi:hypothetical protein